MSYRAYYTDGRTAARHDVQVVIEPRRLHIVDAQGKPIDVWSLEAVRLAEEVYRGQPVRLRHDERGEACLTFDDQEILGELARHRPSFARRHYSRRPVWQRLVGWSFVVVALIGGIFISIPYLAGPIARGIPPSWEETFGGAVANSLGGADERCNDPAGERALAKMLSKLSRGVETPFPFKVVVTDDSTVNAFAAPGGHIVIFQGLIKAAESAEEVAGVLAHEMAHTMLRHPMESLVHAIGLRVFVSLLIGDSSALMNTFVDAAERLVLLSYSREKETQADDTAIDLLNRAETDAAGFVAFFERLKKKGAGAPPASLAFLSSHPLHEERIAAIWARAKGKGKVLSESEWRALRAICTSRVEPTESDKE